MGRPRAAGGRGGIRRLCRHRSPAGARRVRLRPRGEWHSRVAGTAAGDRRRCCRRDRRTRHHAGEGDTHSAGRADGVRAAAGRGASHMTPAEAAVSADAVLTAADVAAAAQLACLLEASAPKPGNVCPGRHFADVRYEDFLASAVAIGGPFAGAAGRPLGATVRLAVEATSQWTRTNTNLGIVLLLAPLVRAGL